MDFTYIDYGINFIDKIKEKNPDEKTILVFSDYFLKNLYIKNKTKNIFKREAECFTIEEFQKKIFKTEKMILTEAKRPLTLFRVLDKDLKEKLKIQNYYDIIDFADLFFKYYKELASAVKDRAEGLQEWQKEYIEKFELLKDKYDKYLEKNEYIPNDWIENRDNFTTEYAEKFKKIIFIDIPYFSPLMRECIKKLDSLSGTEIEFIIQGRREDYNEETLKIEKVSFSQNIDNTNITIYETEDDMSEILNLLYLLKKTSGRVEIFSPAPEKNNYHKIFPKYFISQQLSVLDNTKLYKFMNIQNELLLSLEPKKRMGIPSAELKRAVNEEIFREIYNIDENIQEKFKMIFSEEYKYIDEKLFESSHMEYLFKKDKSEDEQEKSDISQVFHRIYSDLMEIKDYTTVTEFVEYLKKIGFEKFREVNYEDIVEKFYQVVDNIKSSERLCGDNGFKSLFETGTGANLYTLLTKYMEGIEIKEVTREEEKTVGIIKNISEARNKGSADIKYFIDIDNISLPGNIRDSLNFTESQRAENGFMTFEEKKNIIKYRFAQSIFNNKRIVIFVKKNINQEIDKSVFLDEIMIKYNLKVQEKNLLLKEDILNIISRNLVNDKELVQNINSEKYFTLERTLDDFEDRKVFLGTYETIGLKECQYKYFLDSISNIHEEDEEKYGTSLKFLGIVTHKIFDDISKKVYMNIKKYNNYHIDESIVDEVIERALEDNKMKIPAYMDLFFREIMFPKIKENLFRFYKDIERDIAGKKIDIFWGEKSRTEEVPFYSGNLDIFVTGRADLVAETEEGDKYIVDYKTGSRKSEQLDIYSIIMYGDENAALKRIYNVIQGEYEKLNGSKITKTELEQMFKDFVDGAEYMRAEKKTACSNCEYINICRREVV